MPRTETTKPDFSHPHDVSDVALAFGGNISELMPRYSEIPEKFKSRANPFVKLQKKWFYEGIKGRFPLASKPGIDTNKALRHLRAIQCSFEPAHEHKEAGVAYLMSLWFQEP